MRAHPEIAQRMAELDAEDDAEHSAAVALNAAERRAAAADQRLADFFSRPVLRPK